MTETCDTCGREMQITDWPWCPHGPTSLVVVSDTIPGGLTIQNLGAHPVHVDSHSQRKRIMASRGLIEKVEHVDGDRYVGRMV